MLDFSQFRLLSFDCYGTLIDWETGIFAALRPILAAHSQVITDSELLRLYSELESDAERGAFQPYREVLRSVVAGFGKRLAFHPTESEISSLAATISSWPPFPDTIAALARLKARYQLAIISNVDDDFFAGTARHLKTPFDYVITAQQARAYKPSSKIFALAEQRTAVPKAQWLHVGQSLYHDVIPAQSLGISTVWVNRPSPRPGAGAAKSASGKPDLEVPDLNTLVQLTEN